MLFPELYKLQTTVEKLSIAGIIIGTIAIIIGIAILWNQRKIKKQLRQLLEEKKQEE